MSTTQRRSRVIFHDKKYLFFLGKLRPPVYITLEEQNTDYNTSLFVWKVYIIARKCVVCSKIVVEVTRMNQTHCHMWKYNETEVGLQGLKPVLRIRRTSSINDRRVGRPSACIKHLRSDLQRASSLTIGPSVVHRASTIGPSACIEHQRSDLQPCIEHQRSDI